MRWTGWPLSSPEISYHLCNADQYSDDDVNGDDDDDNNGGDDDNNGGHFSLKIRHLCSLLADADWCSDDDFGSCDDDVDQDECEEKDFDGDDVFSRSITSVTYLWPLANPCVHSCVQLHL